MSPQQQSATFDPTQDYKPAPSAGFDPSASYAPAKEAPGMLDKEVPLSSSGNATLSGLQSIGRGVRDAVSGAVNASIPKNKIEGAIAALAPGFGLPAYNMAKGLVTTGKQAAQLPAAVSDINQSSDPLGYYAKAGQETAGQGAGQALTALATEGAMRSAPAVGRSVRTLTGPATPIEVLKARALQNLPATGARSAAETGEALASPPASSQATPSAAGAVPAETELGTVPGDQPIPAGKTPKAGQRPDGPYSGPRTPVMESSQSGHLNKIGYHPETQTAVVEFQNGKVYEYRGVPPEVYQNLQNAESQGSYFAQNLKGRYETNYRGAVKPLSASAKMKQALINQSASLGTKR